MHKIKKSIFGALCLLLPVTALAGLFGSNSNTSSTPAPAPQGIDRVPPPMPVLTPGDFQGQVKSLSDQTQTNMMQQGLDTLKQQQNALPTSAESEPPPLPPKNTGNNTATPQNTVTAPATETVPAAVPSEQENMPASEEENTSPESQGGSSDNYSGFSSGGNGGTGSGNSGSSGGSAPSSSGGSGFNLKY